ATRLFLTVYFSPGQVDGNSKMAGIFEGTPKKRTVIDEEAPCMVACPIRQDARDYIQLIARGQFREGMRVVAERNVLPSACGRICTHPCETECRRNAIDTPIAISWLKRFLADGNFLDKDCASAGKGVDTTGPAEIKYPEEIAIIGSGPAGLAAANDLSLLGYKCTIFEAFSEPGGMLRLGVPVYRLPRDFLDKDINLIKSLGVEIRFNTTFGKDVTFEGLKSDGYDVTFLAVGLPVTRRLPIEGADSEGVLQGITFLNSENCGGNTKIGKKVVVIGGGAVAMDCARTALRLGPDEVHIVCLESRDAMPTTDYEIEETLHEGAILHPSHGPKRILEREGAVTGLETLKVKSVFDRQGRFNPSFHENSESVIEADTIILAIGQASDLTFLEGYDQIEVTRGGTIIADPETLSTGMPGVFAGGDVVLGRGTLTMGLGHGKKAALSIHNYLRKTTVTDNKFRDVKPLAELAETRLDKIKKEVRSEMPTLPPETRITHSEEVELGFSEEMAIREAMRCMNCGNGATVSDEACIACLTCVRVCPFEIPTIEKDENTAYINGDCQSCGICVIECPARAIEFKGAYEDMGHSQLYEIFKEGSGTGPIKKTNGAGPIKKTNGADPVIVNFYCGCNVNLFGDKLPQNTKNVNILGLGKLSPSLILKAFEQGADAALVTSCDGACHFGVHCNSWAEKRVEVVQGFLSSIGLEKERIKSVKLSSHNREEYLQTINLMIEDIRNGYPKQQ
ncbi:MAG: FAD-dependent oxidoreductase, partial [Planctomycetes bacterium]|nr:FAD-dependent oxidoreductase [Planctomycetota bacterium]